MRWYRRPGEVREERWPHGDKDGLGVLEALGKATGEDGEACFSGQSAGPHPARWNGVPLVIGLITLFSPA